MGMTLMKYEWFGMRRMTWRVPSLFRKNARKMGERMAVCALALTVAALAMAQAVSTTTVQGTVYLANGQPGAGTLMISWPAFTTAAGQAIAADSLTMTIPPDGFLSVNLAPNVGATPAGEYYTAVYYMSDGTTSTQYWVVPAAAQASLAQVQAQVMPAAQAVQAVSKAYVDQAIAGLGAGSGLSATGGTLTGPLYLNADPTQPMQAADKHYVDTQTAADVPLAGGSVTGSLTAKQLGALFQVDQFVGADIGAKIQACVSGLSASYGGTCDARNFTGNLGMASNLTISTNNVAILLPCATITTASQIVVTAGTRNVSLRGCALRGGTAASGSTGGTALAYTGSGAMIEVGDPTYATDTPGFHLDNVVISTTGATSATAQGLVAYRTQEMDLESLYFLGNSNQTGMTLDGTGNYTGGTFLDNQFSGFGTAVNGIGHQVTNPATTDWMNASTFVRLHIDCPTSGGNPISGTYGINLQQGDGNTFTGGDVEGCSTALHLGPNAQNNTIVGLRNENSTSQVVADEGSAYNNWMTGGTMFTGKLTDNGTRNSFVDTFHRSFNSLNGDWYMSQQDATLTNHFRLGTGLGNERGLLNEIQTDYGYRWLYGFSDATGGQQLYQVQDLLNNVYRLQIQQWNPGQSSTNNQTALSAAGTGNICFNCSTNAGTGGVTFASGGATPAAVGTVDKAGNAQFVGNLLVGGTTQSTGTMSLRNSADAEVDYYLWPGLTTSQKGSFTYKDWNGNSQWYLVKDASNNWELNSATGGLDSFKAYQNTNSGDTYIDASNSTGHIRLNYETGSGAETDIYSGSSANLDAAFLAPNAIKFPGLAASTGDSCLQIDTSGYITNTGSACASGSGSGGTSGTINTGLSGQIAYYTGNGAALGGMTAVPMSSGGTGATTATGAAANIVNGNAIAPAQVSGIYTVDGTAFASVQAAIAACLASTNASCTVDARASGRLGSAADVIGTLDPGSKGITLLLGSFSDYTIGQVTLRSNLSILGAGSLLTELTSSSGTNQAVFVLAQANNAPAVSVNLKGFNVLPASGATTQIGADLECNSYTNSGMWYSMWEDVWFGNYVTSFPGGGIKFSCPTPASAIQFSQFKNVVAWRANGVTNPGLYICGAGVGNDQFYGGEFDAGNWSDTTMVPNMYIGACPGDTGNAYSLNFYGTTSQGGTNLVTLEGANNIQFDHTHHEGTPGLTNGFQFVCGGSQNMGISIDRPAFGNVGKAFATFTGSVTGTTLTVTGTPAGTIAIGAALVNTGATGIADGTLILAQISGSPGGAGTYTVNNSQSVSSEAMTATGYTLDTGAGCDMDSVQATNMSGPVVEAFVQNHTQSVVLPGLTGGVSTYGLTNLLTNGSSTLNLYNLSRADVYNPGSPAITAFSNSPATNIPITLCAVNGSMNFSNSGSLLLGGVTSFSLPSGQCATFAYDDYFQKWVLTSGVGLSSINSATGAFTFTGAGVSCSSTTCTFPDSGSGTVQTGSEYSPAYYNQSGSSATVGGVTPFTGLGYWQTNAPPAAATAAEVVSAIGSTAVANATAAASFTGSLSGDVTGTQGATTVIKINDGAVPTSANVVATNASGQPTAATAHNESVPRSCTTTNSANAYSCSTSPTFTPAAGDTISVDFNTANTGSATLSVNGAAAATIKKWGNSSSLTANDVLAGHWISATYDGTYWQLEGQLGNANATQINGASVPSSSSVVGTNSSGQAVSAATTGSGSVVLATNPTLSGTTLAGSTIAQGGVTLQNGANASQTLAIQPGSSADQVGAVQFNNDSGAPKWQIQKDANNYLRVTDAANSLDRVILPANANTTINAGAGANAVVVNNTSGSGTAGFIVYEGGSNYSTAALQVGGTGNTTATGYLQGKFMMGTGTMGVAAGAAAGSSPTIACATSHTCDGISGTVTLTTGTSPTTGTLATLSFPNTHTNQANCMVTTLSATAMITTTTWTESTTAITITANAALTASTPYTIKYWCGGY